MQTKVESERIFMHTNAQMLQERKDCGKARKSMEIREKFDGVITAGMFKVKELLLRCNFWRNSVSNIAWRSGR
jgi:hypothetical protein